VTVGILQDTLSRPLTASGVDITYDITAIHLGGGQEGSTGREQLLGLHSARAEPSP